MLRVLLQYFSNLLGKKPMPALSTGKTAPTFQLATTTGEHLSLPEALASGPVLLAFFKVSCPTCQFTFPFLQRLHVQMREQGVQIWGVVQDKAQDGAHFAATFGLTLPILIDDAPYKVSRAYSLIHVPSLFLVKPDGHIEISSEGFCKADLLAIHKSLAQLLSSTPPTLFLPTERIPEYKPG
ncbi:MAG: TlpA disulfide reductase family protein [Terriglobia bacterium]|jgi:peroxiredoxin